MSNSSKENIHVFIGADSEQLEAYYTCAYSIREVSGLNAHIHSLSHKTLRDVGLFNRPWLVNEEGKWSDLRDGKPFSTTFAFTRFLVPEYWEYLGLWSDPNNRWAIFVDSDFVFLEDVNELVRQAEETGKPLSVVKHNYEGKGTTKFNGADQATYNYKLWSSLMVFDMPKWLYDPEALCVNQDTGRSLHTFDWYKPGPENIGSLSEAWNFIPNHSEKTVLDPKAIHYTEGTPLHKGYEDCKYGVLFKQKYQGMLMERARRILDGF